MWNKSKCTLECIFDNIVKTDVMLDTASNDQKKCLLEGTAMKSFAARKLVKRFLRSFSQKTGKGNHFKVSLGHLLGLFCVKFSLQILTKKGERQLLVSFCRGRLGCGGCCRTCREPPRLFHQVKGMIFDLEVL